MFFRILGGLCLGLGLCFILGLIMLIPAIRSAFDTVSDSAGWYGPLEGIFRGSAIYFIGSAFTIAAGLALGVFLAVVATKSESPWFYLGYPFLAAPILFLFVFMQGARRASSDQTIRTAERREANSSDSQDAMADAGERAKAKARSRARAVYGEPIGGPAELDQLHRLLGGLFFPKATFGANYATRTEPESVEWPVVTLRCPDSTTLAEAKAYYEGVGVKGSDSINGAQVVRPGDGEEGKLFVRAPKADDPDQSVTIVIIVDGF